MTANAENFVEMIGHHTHTYARTQAGRHRHKHLPSSCAIAESGDCQLPRQQAALRPDIQRMGPVKPGKERKLALGALTPLQTYLPTTTKHPTGTPEAVRGLPGRAERFPALGTCLGRLVGCGAPASVAV